MHARLTRLTRLMTATILALAAFAAVAGSAQATTEDPTCGNKLCLATTHEPASDFVVPNGYLRYRVDVTNPGTSTATKVTLTFTLDQRVTLVSSPAGCTQPTPTQPPPPLITCFLGSVKPTAPGKPLTFRFLVQVPPDETRVGPDGKFIDPLSSTASISADARRNDTGNDPGDPTAEDFSDFPEVVAVDLREGQSASFIPADVPLTLDTDPDGSGATGSDTRTAKFKIFASGFSTTAVINDQVEDAGFVCPEKLKCPGGGWTQASIPGPLGTLNPFAFPSSLEVELHYDATTVPNGLTEKSYVMLHLTDAGVLERISEPCSSDPPPCLKDVDLQSNGDLIASALVTENIRYR
jgi:uncharacterized repeat protein (TIGR01451 family)